MVSKNNIQLKDRYATKQVPHYGIRKLSVGVASVLLSTTLYMGVTAHADTIAEANPQPTIDQPASTATGNATGSVQLKPTADQSESTTTNSPASETNASSKSVQTVSPEQSADTTDVQSASGQSESVAANSNVPENDGSAASSPTALPKQPANADTPSTATMSGVQPFVNLAVESDNNDLTPTHETIDSKWMLHYVNQADHKQELKDPTVITMQYTRTDTPQSDGTTKYGDWSYVPGSFKQTGTPITVKDSNNLVKQDNVDKNGENFDVFTITAMYPTVGGYVFYNGINGTRLRDNLRNNERQADSMSKDFYAEYELAKPTRETVGSQWRIHYIDSTNREHELKAPTVINMQYARTNTPQSNGTIQHGDWSYVSGSFKLTGTPITVNDSNNPVKEDNVDKNGQNVDTFTINAMYPSITGYNFHDGINNAHLHDYLLNYDPNGTVQAPTMGKDFYVEYDPISERSVAVKFVDDQSYDSDTVDHTKQVGQAITLTGHDGDTVNLNLTVPDKYQLADGQQLPTTYTFAKGSGDLKIHLVHKVVQREATVNVKLVMMTEVDIEGIDFTRMTTTQERWGQLGDDFSVGAPGALFEALPSVEVGTLTGHINYDLVDNEVISFGDDWTTLNLGGRTYQLPNGTDVVNGVLTDSDDGSLGKPLREYYLKHYSIVNPGHSVDPDYSTRPWYGYLSVNETNDPNSPLTQWNDLGLQGGLAGNEPNTLAKANGDQAATSVEMANKTIDVSVLDNPNVFSEQNGQLQATLPVPVVGVYVPYVEKTATRTINVTNPDGKTIAVKQTATLAKQVDFGKDAHPAWTTGEWANYDVPAIPGYTASQSQIAKTVVTGTTEDQTVNITYTANSQTSTVVYQTEDGTPVHTTTVNGHTGQTVKVSNEVPVGWHVVNGTVPSEITFGPNGTPKTVVTIAHIHATVTPDAPKTTSDKLPDNPAKTYPAGVSETDLNKMITRTIKVTTPDGQTKTIEQTAKLTRTADVDEVTGEVKYSDWTTGNWSAYAAPDVPGYTASQSHVAQQAVTDATKDQTIDITYTANDHQISVEYVDNATGQVLKTDHVSGKTGQTVSITPHAPDGWELVSGQSVPSEVTLGADGAPATVIKVQPQERSVAVKFVDDQSFDPDSSDGKTQVGQAITFTGRDGDTVKVNVTVPDKYQLANGQQLPTTYTFTAGSGDVTIHLVHKVVQREAAVNVQLMIMTGVGMDGTGDSSLVIPQTRWRQLDDSLKHGASDLGIVCPSVEVGTLTGHVNYDVVDNSVVSLGDDWTTLNLGGQTYQLPNGTDVVNGVMIDSTDSWGQSLREMCLEYLKDDPNADPDYSTRPWHAYLSVNATNGSDLLAQKNVLGLQGGLAGNESNVLAKANGDRAATAVEMTNKTIDVSLLKYFDNTDFSEQDGQLQSTLPVPVVGVYVPYVEKTATRTINVTTPDGKTTTVKQTATLEKQVNPRPDAHPAWTTGEWTSYDVPTIPGYTASQLNVAKETVTGATSDQTVNITYTANPQTATVVYQTEDGTPVHTTTVNGQAGQTVKVSSEVPAGWKIINGKVPSEITFGPNGTPQTVVTIAHQHVTVDPDHPQNNGTKLPDNPAKTFNGVEANDLNKTITRTIKVTTPDGQTKTVAQTAKLTRNADVDEVTGEVMYGKWTTGNWDAYEVSTVSGYTASQNEVPATEVASDMTDQMVNISYTANSQTTHINYIDDAGKTVHTTAVTGKTGEMVKVPNEVPAGWMITKGEVPSEISFGPNGHADETITISHRHVTVDPDHPQNNGTKLPDNPAKTFEGVEANDLNNTITRTIKVTMPDGKTTTTKQIAKLARNADVDEVTGEVTYGNWTTDEWAAYDVPSVAGYAPSQTKVDKETVTAASKDTTTVITYSPVQHQISVEYVDDDDYGKIVKTDQIPGKTDQTITVTPNAPTNYDLVDNDNRTYTVTSADGQTVQIHVKHHQVKTTESKTVTRTINVHTPHDGVKTVKQTVTLNRDVTTDQVTGDKTYGGWTTGQWKVYTPEAIPGYTPSINEVPNTNVDGSLSDQTVNVTYTADAQKFEIVYVDDAKGGAVVKTDQVSGKTDETVKVTPDVPSDYKVVSEVPGSYTMTANSHQTITVHLAHQTKTTSENKTVTRTINVHTPHDGVKTIKQTATLTRGVTTDQVTGEKTYGDWSTTSWDHYEVPAVAGYVPSIKQVVQQVVNGTTTDQTINVIYTSGEHTTHINYVDGDGNTVHTTTIKGQTDGTAQVPNETPAGWTLTDGRVPDEITFGPNGHADVTVTISHKHVTVTSDQPKTSSDKLPDNPAKTYPNSVGHDDLNKTITRTIKITTPDGQTKTVEQTAKLTRTADVDEVTGEVTYGGWTAGEWSNYDVPAVPGYTPSQSEVPATKVTDTIKDQTVTISYTANNQTTHVSYVDGDGKTVHTTIITGKTDQTVKVPNETPAGWTITNGQVPTEITFGPDGHADVTVTVGHQHVTVTPDQLKTTSDNLPNNPGKTYPSGVGHDDLNKTITRTIEVATPAGKTDTIKQTAKLTRTADVDEVTGEVTYGKWTTGAWSSYAVPTVAGYTPSQAVVAEVAVNADMTDQTVTVTYTVDSHTTHINYVDEGGNVVHTTTVTGQTDQAIKVPNETPAGWMITTGEVPSEVTFGADGHTDVTVSIDHQTVTVTPGHPQADGTKLPDNPTLTFHGVGKDDLNKTVTRTIKLNVPGQAPQVITQTARLIRTATVDEVTGEVIYGDWTSGQWDAYEVPAVNGYTASQTTIPAVNVTIETTSQDIVIDYVAVPTAQTTSINNQTDENQVTSEKVVTVANGTVQDTKQDAIKNSAQSTMQDTKQLPQTGNDNRAGLLSLIGSSLMAGLAIFGLSKKKKHEN